MSYSSMKIRAGMAGILVSFLASSVWAQCNAQKFLDSVGECGQDVGKALSMDGHLLAVGAPAFGLPPDHTGAVFILQRVGGNWLETDLLFASDGQANDFFGEAVALDGDTLVVGAQNSSPAGVTAAGSAYVFVRQGDSWVETQKLLASDVSFGSRFGTQVAIHGDVMAISAPHNASVATEAGAVYVFERMGRFWVETDKLVANDTGPSDQLGTALAIHGNRIIATSTSNTAISGAEGAAYMFELVGTTWTQTARISPTDGFVGQRYGHAVALEGHRLFVSALFDADFGTATGAVYVYEHDGLQWNWSEKLHSIFPSPQYKFGDSLAVAGSVLVVGEALAVDPQGVTSGAFHVFRKSSRGWQGAFRFTNPNGEAAARLGRAVAASGSYVAAGAPQAQNGHPHPQCFVGNVWLVDVPSFATAFCFGVGCPCGNDDPAAGCANGSSQGARLAACGTGSVASNDATFTGTGLAPNQPALLFRGQNAVNGGNGVPFGDGLRCAGGQVRRVGIRFADATGNATWGPGLAQQGGWQAGDTLRLQAWYRTPGSSPCGSNFNTSNGVEAQFGP